MPRPTSRVGLRFRSTHRPPRAMITIRRGLQRREASCTSTLRRRLVIDPAPDGLGPPSRELADVQVRPRQLARGAEPLDGPTAAAKHAGQTVDRDQAWEDSG